MTQHTEVVVVGGGQARLAAGHHLRRRGLDFVILDAEAAPGGSWQHRGDSLHLFSPAEHSSLPGRPMPAQTGEAHPAAGHVVDHLADYEKRYDLPVRHGTRVHAVRPDGERLPVEADCGTWRARAVASATGSWSRPFPPRSRGAASSPGGSRTPCTTAPRPTSPGSASSWSAAATPVRRSPPTSPWTAAPR